MRVRFEFSKDKEARYVSHLDMIRVFERSLRRAGLPLSYSQDLTRTLKWHLAPPSLLVLPVNVNMWIFLLKPGLTLVKPK